MSEIITALRIIALESADEELPLSALDDLDDKVIAITEAVTLLERHHVMADHAATQLALQSARDAINGTRDGIAAAAAQRVLDKDLMPLRGIRQGAGRLLCALNAIYRLGSRKEPLVLDVDGVTTFVKAMDVKVCELGGRQFFVVGDRSWPIDEAIAVTSQTSTFGWPALMTRCGSVVRVRPA